MFENAKRRSISASAATGTSRPKALLFFMDNYGRHEVKTVKVGGTGLEEMIHHKDEREPVLVASRHPIGKENAVNVVILTAIYLPDKEPDKPARKSPAIRLDEDPSEPWYFTHI